MTTLAANPTSDEAVSGTWTGSAGTRYTAVDDYPDPGPSPADLLTHGTTTAGNLTFGYSAFAVPALAHSISVGIDYYDYKGASQACNVGGRLKVGGNYYNAATHNPANGTYTQRTDTWATNPKSTAAWTADDVNGVGANALQAFGWVSTDANPAINLTSIRLTVTYVDPITGTGAFQAKAVTLGGTGAERFIGTAAFSAVKAALAATGRLVFSGTGAFSAQAAQLAGTGTVTVSGLTATGAFSAQPAQLSAIGRLVFAATGAILGQAPTLAGTGAVGDAPPPTAHVRRPRLLGVG